MSALEAGLTNEAQHTVEEHDLASRWGSGLAEVLATPVLVAYCERCARLAVDPLLPEGRQTVGSFISLSHLAPTPAGAEVTVRAELTRVDGPRLRFDVEAWDAAEKIAEGEHERFVIDIGRFQRRVEEKAERLRG